MRTAGPSRLTTFSTAFGLVVAGGAQAADIAAGWHRAHVHCAACHGLPGMGQSPDAPHRAGQLLVDLISQLRQFRSGRCRKRQ